MFKVILVIGVIVLVADGINDCSEESFLLRGSLIVLANSRVERRAEQADDEWETCLWFSASYIYGKQTLCNEHFYRVVGFSGYDHPARRSVHLYDAYGPYKAVSKYNWRSELLNFTCYDEHADVLANTFKFIAAPVNHEICLVAAMKGDIYHYALFAHHNHTCTEVNYFIKAIEVEGFDLFGKNLEPTCCHK